VGLVLAGLAAAGGVLMANRIWAAGEEAHAVRPPARPPEPAATSSPSPAATGPRRKAAAPTNVYAGIGPGHLSPAVRGVPHRLYVPNSEAGTVTVIDPRTFRVIHTFPTGAYDQHVTPSWDLRRLYVDNTTANTLTVIDPVTGRRGRDIHVADPYNLYFTPNGRWAIVVAEGLQRLDFRDPHTFRLVRSVHIPAAGPDHLDFSADGRSLLVSCEFAGVAYRVDVRTMRVTGQVHLGGLPVDVKLSPDGRRYYVANQGLGGVTMVSTRTLHIVGFVRTGDGAHGLAVSRDARRLYVANRLAGTISVIGFRTHRVEVTWRVGGSPDMLQVSPNGRQLWFSNRYNGTVSVVDTRTGRLIRTIAVGASPHGLAYFPQPGSHSLGHNGVYR
jgi:YVTN family beta-propeller protein